MALAGSRAGATQDGALGLLRLGVLLGRQHLGGAGSGGVGSLRISEAGGSAPGGAWGGLLVGCSRLGPLSGWGLVACLGPKPVGSPRSGAPE